MIAPTPKSTLSQMALVGHTAPPVPTVFFGEQLVTMNPIVLPHIMADSVRIAKCNLNSFIVQLSVCCYQVIPTLGSGWRTTPVAELAR